MMAESFLELREALQAQDLHLQLVENEVMSKLGDTKSANRKLLDMVRCQGSLITELSEQGELLQGALFGVSRVPTSIYSS